MNGLALKPWQPIRCEIEREGWRSPNAYCAAFDCLDDFPSVYLFSAIDPMGFKRGVVGYVGMSKRLATRISGHPIRPLIEKTGLYVQTWFKPCPIDQLREVERELIKRFDPPWNIAGRNRGIAA
jgi:hypothetical protein